MLTVRSEIGPYRRSKNGRGREERVRQAWDGKTATLTVAQRVAMGRRSVLALPSSEEAKRGRFAYTALPAALVRFSGLSVLVSSKMKNDVGL